MLAGRLHASLTAHQRDVLAILGAVHPAPLATHHLAALVPSEDAEAVVRSLEARRLVESEDERWVRAPGGAANGSGTATWARLVVEHFTQWVETCDELGRLVEERETVLRVIQMAAQAELRSEVVRLALRVEPALAAAGRWGACEDVLRVALRAAEITGADAVEAWAEHELGICAVVRGDLSSARRHLEAALTLRRRIGDDHAAAVTARSLDLLA